MGESLELVSSDRTKKLRKKLFLEILNSNALIEQVYLDYFASLEADLEWYLDQGIPIIKIGPDGIRVWDRKK